ncbi:MAG: hypothetical protein QXL57_07565 [Candidatus Bathyarchaeia archaeon]
MVNKLAIAGSIVAFISLLFPWWSLEASIVGVSPVTFHVYPGWFSGNLNDVVNVFRKLDITLGVNFFEECVGALATFGILFCSGILFALIGAFIRSNMGRGIIALGFFLILCGIYGFCYTWNKLFYLLQTPISFSHSELSPLFSVTWGWSYGLYIAIFAFLLLLVSVAFHPVEVKAKEEVEIEKKPSEQKHIFNRTKKRTYLESIMEARAREMGPPPPPPPPLLCRLRLHRWRYYGQDVVVTVREYVKVGDARIPVNEGVKLINNKRKCARCGIKQEANIFTNEDGTLSMRGWRESNNSQGD